MRHVGFLTGSTPQLTIAINCQWYLEGAFFSETVILYGIWARGGAASRREALTFRQDMERSCAKNRKVRQGTPILVRDPREWTLSGYVAVGVSPGRFAGPNRLNWRVPVQVSLKKQRN